MQRFWFGSLSPKFGATATVFFALLLMTSAVPAQSRDESNNDDSNSSARDRDRSRSRNSQANDNDSAARESRGSQASERGHANLGVVLYNESNALEIRRVLPDSAAEEAGLERGDEILSVNGRRVSSVDQLKRQLERAGTDEQVEIGILRDGRRRTVEATLSSRGGYASRGRNRNQPQWNEGQYGRNDGRMQNYNDQGYRNSGRGYANQGYNDDEQYGYEDYGPPGYRGQGYANRGGSYGNQGSNPYGNRGYSRGSRQAGNGQDEEADRYGEGYRGWSDEDRAFLGITLDENARDGVRVTGIYPESPAEEAGLRRGDEIVAVDDDEVRSNRDLQRLLSQRDPDDDISITVARNGRERTLHTTLASEQQVFAAERRARMGRGGNNREEYQDGYRGNNSTRRRQQDQNVDEGNDY